MYRIISFKEKQKWDSIIEMFHNRDIYYFHEYCSLYHLIGDGEPYLFFYEDYKGSAICYPFLKRQIDLPFSANNTIEGKWYDIITPYGYGGPLTQGVTEDVVKEFRKVFDEYCYENNIISEFIRFHPLLKNHQNLEGVIDVIYDRETVFIDLTKSEEDMTNNYHKNHRRNLNKAKRNELEFRYFEKQEALQQIDVFYHLYKQTMDKLNASTYYYFSLDYLRSLLKKLDNNSMIAGVFLNDKMISAALCLYEKGNLHYHLGCSLKEYLHLGTNIFLFHKIALLGSLKGCHTFHLGGGYGGSDSLFYFKKKFNSQDSLEFYIGKKIHNQDQYNLLVSSWERYYKQKVTDGFFPMYRTKAPATLPVRS